MPRKPRNCPGGVVFHVLNRAVAQIRILRTDKDFLAFEKTLEEAHQRHPLEIFSYCVMANHWHLVVRPLEDGDLSRFVSWLTMSHAQRWRHSHGTVGYGPLYQGRFKAFPIQEDAHLLTVLRYVERNPVRAGLVKHAEDWRWSSLHRRLNSADKPLLSPWPLRPRSDWLDWVNRPQTPAEEQALATAIRRSRPFGDQRWQRQMADTLGFDSCFRPTGRPRKSQTTS
jgi:putative transposase